MIKVAISGADSPEAGELVRILVNHPDVELKALIAPALEGKDITTAHHGLIGEPPMRFCSGLPEKIDVLFVCGSSLSVSDFRLLRVSRVKLKIILLHPIEGEFSDDEEIPVYGMPEINRKPLVRGALSAVVPTPLASLALVPLYPLAYNLLLNGDLSLRYYLPFFLSDAGSSEKAKEEIRRELTHAQRSFTGSIEIASARTASERGAELEVEIRCPIDMEHISEFYAMYDDHHFAFPVTSPVSINDVEGTDKCIFTMSKPERDTLRIHAVADPRMRGGAGEAVHIMNLLCQLHEKTGLALKASRF